MHSSLYRSLLPTTATSNQSIITKNVDGFHQEAGAKNVLEIYGTLRSASCTKCEYKVATKEIAGEI